MFRFILLALVAAGAAAHQCGPVDTVDNFQFKEFAQGTWHELARYKNPFIEGVQCGTSEYTRDGEDKYKTNDCVVVSGKRKCTEAAGRLDPEANNHGKLIVAYPRFPSGKVEDYNVNVIATDYKTFAILHVCKHDEANNVHIDLAWVLGRNKSVSTEDRAKIEKIIKDSTVLESNKFEEVDSSEEACKVS